MKACPKDAITLEDNLAVINSDKCDSCGICAEKCPMKCMYSEMIQLQAKLFMQVRGK